MSVTNGVQREENTNVDGEVSLRPILCELGVLSRPHGSAMVSQGDTVVMAAVYGPTEVRMQRLRVEQASIEAVYRPRTGVPGTAERLRESILCSTCEIAMRAALYPRTSISLIIQEMQDNGGLLACSLNAACLALVDSGISMRFLFAAVTCGVKDDGSLIIDPTSTDELSATLTIAFDSLNYNVIASHTTGQFPRQLYLQAVNSSRNAVKFLFDLYRDIIRKYATAL